MRFFSTEYVADGISRLIQDFGVREIAFLDDIFVLDKKRLHRIFDRLRRDGIRFPWTCMTRVNNLDYETLRFMKENGCWQIRIGIESGNQEVLDFIRKGSTLEQVRNVIDTPETLNQTIEFGLSIPLSDIVVTVNTPIPGTESYELAKSYG